MTDNQKFENTSIVLLNSIEKRILTIRGVKVMLDSDLAELYGVTTKRLNEQVKRNRNRFPTDFMFKLTEHEKKEVVANCDHLSGLKYSKYLPNAFTEHGTIMAATVLNTSRAVGVSIYAVRAFRAFIDAKKIIFIGYSMPDSDGFMRAFIHAAMAKRYPNQLPKIYVIDMCEKVHNHYKKLFNDMYKPVERQYFDSATKNTLREILYD